MKGGVDPAPGIIIAQEQYNDGRNCLVYRCIKDPGVAFRWGPGEDESGGKRKEPGPNNGDYVYVERKHNGYLAIPLIGEDGMTKEYGYCPEYDVTPVSLTNTSTRSST